MLTEQDQINLKAQAAFADYQRMISRRTDRFFAWLMIGQWFAGIAIALWLSPFRWHGNLIASGTHLWAVLVPGGIITAFPVALAFYMPGAPVTRHVIAGAQMLMSSLLIHLSGGRLEVHLHVFGSLALLAFYRDWRVLITASLIVAIDHTFRGAYFPESVYGQSSVTFWRAVEHLGWVGFAVVCLAIGIRQSLSEIKEIALRQASLEVTKELIEDKVRRRTAQLQDTVEQLETFCHSVSHDLRSPLRGIQGFSRILLDDYSANLDPFGRECAQRITSAAKRMDRLMGDLLEYTRVSRAAISLQPVSVRDVIDEVLSLLAEDIRLKSARIILLNEFPFVKAHRSTLVQVLLNLISNALKFVKTGDQPLIRIGYEFIDGRVRLWVQDNGIGIDPVNFKRLFGMFERLNDAKAYPGTGIGLAIVRKAIERMGGTVDLEAELGQGSRFWIELPRAEAPALNLPAAPQQPTINVPLAQPAAASIAISV